ncbi:MAG: zf-TFIIB domain-containing protein [Chlamydiota bacterium]|nr:zf-TFIIB domain-containing protein [Chlamydiota bacterium]
MNCPDCNVTLINEKQHGVEIPECPSCRGFFILEEALKKIEVNKDPFLEWLDPELWKHEQQYEAIHGERDCPSCRKSLHTLKYMHSDIEVDVCHECRAVWLEEGELEKILSYLEDKITTETVGQYLKELGHETVEVIKGEENLKGLSMVLKLLGYRFFSQFPAIEKLIQSLPKL